MSHRIDNPIQPPRFRIRWADLAAMLATCLGIAVLVVTAFSIGAASSDPPVSRPASVATTPAVPEPEPSPTGEPVPACTDAIADAGGICQGEPTDEVSQGGTVPDWAPEGMAPCPTEDSMGCYWDATAHGNGDGCSFVAQDGFILYHEPGCPAAEAEEQPAPSDEQPSTNDGELAPEDPQYTPETWPFTHGETLLCGDDAYPAIDYRSDVGWWVYCEPALARTP